MKEIIFLKPVFKQMLWGGNRLRTEWNYKIPGDDTGECWAVSAHPQGDCVITNGVLQGKHLSELWDEHRELFGNLAMDNFPLLVKIITAESNLSIQVHPDDDYARVHENSLFGKSECWYVLNCPENATLILGHYAKNKEELSRKIKDHQWNELLREVPVEKGDFIQVPPGTIHSIERGVTLLEIQQNSALTYRLYDYDRLSNGKTRELHIQKGIDVIETPSRKVSDYLHHTACITKNNLILLGECKYYKIWKLNVEGVCKIILDVPFLIFSVINGTGVIDKYKLKKGYHFIIPYGYGPIHFEGNMELIGSTYPT